MLDLIISNGDCFIDGNLKKTDIGVTNGKISHIGDLKGNDGQKIIENFEKILFDLAEKGSFSNSLIKFDEAMRQTIEMASSAYKNEFLET